MRVQKRKQIRITVVNMMQLYIVIMLLGISIRTYITHSITIVWIINSLGLIGLFSVFLRSISTVTVKNATIYIGFCIITFLINYNYFNGSIKSIGTNINIIIVPFYCFLIDHISKTKPFTNYELGKLLSFISLLGVITLLYSWISNYHDILGIFNGSIRVYRASVAGFFYGKNIYGAFISLTLASDLFLYEEDHSKKRIWIILLKVIAVTISFSRAALLQMCIMLIVFVWTKRRHSFKQWMLLFFAIIIGAIIVIILARNNRITDFFTNSVFRVSSGDAGRAHLRKQALERVGFNPIKILFGVGFSGMDSLNIDVDNTYLYLLFSGGLLKILFMVYYLHLSIKNINTSKTEHTILYRICISVLISYFAFAYFESVALLELGLLNFIYTFYVFFLPCGYGISRDISLDGEIVYE